MRSDPYINENGVLENKLNIAESEALENAITSFVFAGTLNIIENPLSISSLFDIIKIHKMLFEEVFEWAGKFRTITMYKAEPILNGCTVDYSPAEYIKKELNEINAYFQSINIKSLNPKEKVKEITKIIAEVWRVHPFREGNTRATSLLLYLLLIQNGFKVRYEFLVTYSKYFRNALVLASLYSKSESEYLEGIISDIVSVKNIDTNKYYTIDNYEVEKYNYSYHTLEKLKTRCAKERK